MTIGERIRALRNERGLSQTELAKAVGISKQSLYKYETGVIANIPSEKLRALAEKLGVTPAFLLGWEEDDVDKLKFALFHASEGITDEMLDEVLSFAQYVRSRHGV